MFTPVLSRINTKSEKDHLLDQLSALSSEAPQSAADFHATLRRHLSSSLAETIFANFSENQFSPSAYLKDLSSQLEKLLPLRLTLAFDPPKQTLDTIVSWVNTYLGPGHILELATDHSLLGGALISFKGEYRDYSLQSRLRHYLSQPETKQQLLKHVLPPSPSK